MRERGHLADEFRTKYRNLRSNNLGDVRLNSRHQLRQPKNVANTHGQAKTGMLSSMGWNDDSACKYMKPIYDAEELMLRSLWTWIGIALDRAAGTQ